MTHQLSYAHLLENARTETARLQTLTQDITTELYQMSQHYLRMGWHKGFQDYYAQRREVHTQLVYAEADLQRSKARERKLAALVAAGEVRGRELLAVA